MRRPRLVIGLVGAVVAATVAGTTLSASAGTSALVPGLPVAEATPCAGVEVPVAGTCLAPPGGGGASASPTTTPSTGATGSPTTSPSASPSATACPGLEVPVDGTCLAPPGGGGGASASPSATTTPQPSGSASPTTSPAACPIPVPGVPCVVPGGGGSASATPTASTTPSPSGPAQAATPTVDVTPATITAKQKSLVTGTAQPGAAVELYAYSRPSTDYVLVRSGEADENGDFSFEVGPSGNTRLYVLSGGVMSETTVLTVRTDLNLKVTRTGTRTYRFTGSTLPKRKGQLVTVFYQPPGGKRVIASRARVSSTGTYNVTRTFGSNATYDLFTGTGVDNDNAAGTSPKVRVRIR